ncbi:uncharacterized protein LOC134420947 [Melospiza melodia melodia]|uniref:uncharacterized protein LOC134420947 n=1 Tax=Melospiza melodia melodia TaxID=1914991 RepID=UPI002FCE7C14
MGWDGGSRHSAPLARRGSARLGTAGCGRADAAAAARRAGQGADGLQRAPYGPFSLSPRISPAAARPAHAALPRQRSRTPSTGNISAFRGPTSAASGRQRHGDSAAPGLPRDSDRDSADTGIAAVNTSCQRTPPARLSSRGAPAAGREGQERSVEVSGISEGDNGALVSLSRTSGPCQSCRVQHECEPWDRVPGAGAAGRGAGSCCSPGTPTSTGAGAAQGSDTSSRLRLLLRVGTSHPVRHRTEARSTLAPSEGSLQWQRSGSG